MMEAQEPARNDRDNILLIIDPRQASPTVQARNMRVDVICKRLVAHPGRAVDNRFECRSGWEVQRQEHGVNEGYGTAEGMPDYGD